MSCELCQVLLLLQRSLDQSLHALFLLGPTHTSVESFPAGPGPWPSMLRISCATPCQCSVPADSVRGRRRLGGQLSRLPSKAAGAVAVDTGLRGSPGSGQDE